MHSVARRNIVTVKGNGEQVIIFAHGFGCSQETWNLVNSDFENDYTVVLFDYVGAGNSDFQTYYSAKYRSLDGYAQDILDICDELQLQQPILLGHSVSAMIAVIAALKQRELFKRLIFMAPSPYFFTDGDYNGRQLKEDIDGLFDMMDSNYLGWSSMMAPLIMGNADRPELGESLASSFCTTDPAIARECARTTFYADNRSLLTKLCVDSLTLQCSDDMLAPASVG